MQSHVRSESVNQNFTANLEFSRNFWFLFLISRSVNACFVLPADVHECIQLARTNLCYRHQCSDLCSKGGQKVYDKKSGVLYFQLNQSDALTIRILFMALLTITFHH